MVLGPVGQIGGAGFDLATNAGGYALGAHQQTEATLLLNDAVSNLTAGSARANRALSMLIPAAAFAGTSKFTQVAAAAQEQLDQLRASTIGTSLSFKTLSSASDSLARQFPIGTRGAREMVASIANLGVASDKQKFSVQKLGAEFIKLGAATGESGAIIGAAVANLDRSFGASGLNPDRIKSIGNAVVALRNQFGGTASGIVGFAQALSPFARQLGLGEKATLGIAASFNKLGADSGSAATAVNKVMADMGRATRDGGPQLQKYASLLGMTAKQFKDLSNANPAKALTQVVKSLGQPGAAAQRNLDLLGFDGVRTQAPLLRIAQSDLLGKAIDTAVNANPNTQDEAAKAAMSGLNSSLEKLRGSSDQLAEALGRPVLGPLTAFSNKLSDVVGTFSKVAGSGFVQDIGKAGAILGLTKLVAGTATRVGVPAMLARNTFKLDPISALRTTRMMDKRGFGPDDLEAMRGQLYDELDAAENSRRPGKHKLVRQANSRIEAVEATQAARNAENPNGWQSGARKTFAMGVGWETGAGPGETPTPRGPSLWQRARGGLQVTSAGLGTGWNIMRGQTDSILGGPGTYKGTEAGQALAKSLREAATEAKGFGQKMSVVKDGIGQTVEALKKTSAAEQVGQAVGRRGGLIGRAAMGTTQAALTGGRELLGGVAGFALDNPITAGLGAGLAAYSFYNNRKNKAAEQLKQENESVMGSSITQGTDAYNEALGRAIGSTTTLADTMYTASKKISEAASKLGDDPTSWNTATHIGYGDRDAAGKAKTGNTFLKEGGTSGAIAQIRSLYGAGSKPVDPGHAQLIKYDLIKSGFNDKDINSILGQVQGIQPGSLSAADTSAIISTSMKRNVQKGGLGAGNKKNLDRILASLDADEAATVQRLGGGQAAGEYASAQRAKAMNKIMAGLNPENDISGTGTQRGVSGVRDYLAGKFKEQTKGAGYGYNASGTGSDGRFDPNAKFITGFANVSKPPIEAGPLFDSLKGLTSAAGMAARGLTDMRTATGRRVVGAITGTDTGFSVQQNLNRGAAMLYGSKVSGTGLYALAQQATPDSYERQAATLAAQRRMDANVANQKTSGASQGVSLLQDMQKANAIDSGEDPTAQLAAAASVKANLDNVKSQMQQRLTGQIQFQLSSFRSNQDYQTSLGRSEDDFNRGRMRSLRDFAKNIRRAAEDAAKAMYDPYRRIGVEALWDSKSLLVNLGDQTRAMQQQLVNLAKIRKMGLSNQAISQLGLTDSAHAQQLSELVSGSSRGDISGLNAATATKVGLAGKLNTDASNTTYARAREDFNTSLKDQSSDFKRSLDRGASDFKRSQDRMKTDFHNSQLTITNDWATLQKNLYAVQHGQSIDSRKLMGDDLKSFQDTVGKAGKNLAEVYKVATGMSVDPSGNLTFTFPNTTPKPAAGAAGATGGSAPVPGAGRTGEADRRGIADPKVRGAFLGNPGAGNGLGGTSVNPYAKTNPAVGANQKLGQKMATKYGWGYGPEWNALQALWQQESGWNTTSGDPNKGAYGIPQAYAKNGVNPMSTYGRDWRTNPATQIRWGLDYIRQRFHDPLGAVHHKDQTNTTFGAAGHYDKYGNALDQKGGWYAKGALFVNGPQTIGVGEGGPEAVVPLSKGGNGMNIIRAIERYMQPHDYKSVATSAARTYIMNTTYMTDHSVHIAKVESHADSRKFIGDMQAMSRRANLTRTPTRRTTSV